MRRFTLHVRLTKGCNADCSYCSSWMEAPGGAMTPAAFVRALDTITTKVFPVLGLGRHQRGHLEIQYVGGEILTVPAADLRQIVIAAREHFAPYFDTIRDGVQSNLIGSDRRVLGLATLFGERIGTSVDPGGSARTLAGSAEGYTRMAAKSRATLERRRRIVPAQIFTVDEASLGRVPAAYEEAEAAGADLTLRPVFAGGRAVQPAALQPLIAAYTGLFDQWIGRGRIRVEPLAHLLQSRLAAAAGPGSPQALLASGCPFQTQCARVSLDLEPNGDLYVCLDMADSGQLRLGNALDGSFDVALWQRLEARAQHLDTACRACTWREACQGGCMSEGLHATGSPYGRTHLCALWQAVFARIDDAIAVRGAAALAAWLRQVNERAPLPLAA